jgi:hypothetical protein
MVRRLTLAAGAVMAAGAVLSANLVIPTAFREVVADASLIVRGTVTDVRSFRAPGRGIESVATLAVQAVLKGEATAFVSVRVPGGTIGTRRFVMVGAPSFQTGEQAVVFLRRDGEGAWRPVGLSMGVIRVRADRASGRLAVAPPVVGGWTAATAGPVVRGDARRQTMAVTEFESLVRLVAAGRALPSRMPFVQRPVK